MSYVSICLCHSRIHCRLIWDAYFYGSIISTVFFQTINSLLLIILLSADLAIAILPYHQSYLFSISAIAPLLVPYIFATILSLVLVAYNVGAWCRGPKHTWKMGVKEVAINGKL